MTRTAIAAFAAQTQAQLEEIYPALLTVAGVDYPCTRGAWRNRAPFTERLDGALEVRTVALRLRRELLAEADATLVIFTTTVYLREPEAAAPGIECLLIEQRAGPTDPAWHLVLEAAAPSTPQA